ncbi:MAG: DUF4279 domain-containing protein, partial [Nitrospiraceae bacterium]
IAVRYRYGCDLMSEEPDETYFAFSATLRIHGEGLDFDEITRSVGLRPTHTHKKGESRRPGGHPYRDDAWHYSSGLPEEAPLDAHLQTLWADVAPARDFLLSLKSRCSVDVFCGYRSNCDHAGFQVEPTSLAIFTALDVPFGVSVIVILED